MSTRSNIKRLTFEETWEIGRQAGLSLEAVRRAYLWAHSRSSPSWDGLDRTLPRRAEEVRNLFELPVLALEGERRSPVDDTINYLFRLRDGQRIESVLIPHFDNRTLCVSSQAGCALGCRFCATARLGLTRHLDAWEIVDQLHRVTAAAGARITDVVFMGMGEPLHNYDEVLRAATILHERRGAGLSARRITISTAGIVPGIHRYVDERRPFRLAFSLVSAIQEKRLALMPITAAYPLGDLVDAIRRYAATLGTRKWVTLQYVAIPGVNLGPDDVAAMGELLSDLPYIVDVVPYNPIDLDDVYRAPTATEIHAFTCLLRALERPIKVRHSGGKDMGSGCGQLAARWA